MIPLGDLFHPKPHCLGPRDSSSVPQPRGSPPRPERREHPDRPSVQTDPPDRLRIRHLPH